MPPYGDPPGGGTRGKNAVIAVVPAHNEEDSIAETVSEIRGVCPGLDVLVIDDGSTDNTGMKALQAGAMVIDMRENMGVGEAERRGLYYAYSHGYRYAVRLDGDGQHPASGISDLLGPLCREEADVVVGSRFLRASCGGYEVSKPRRLGIAYFRVLLRLSASRRFTDPTSGFRAYSREAMFLVSRTEPQRYPEVTSLRVFSSRGLAVREVPVRMRERARGRSTLGALSALFLVVGVTLEFLRPLPRLSPAGPAETALA
jgi:glycosyltransferase involved in cell wall biosynthesis